MCKTRHCRSTFGSCDVEKVHAAAARSTCGSQKWKNWRSQTTFGSKAVKKVHALAAHVEVKSEKTEGLGPFVDCGSWAVEKKCIALRREAHVEVKSAKNCRARSTFGSWDVALLEVEMFKKCAVLCREAHVQVKSVKNRRSRRHFLKLGFILRVRRKGFCTSPKVGKTWGFCSSFKSAGRRGTFEEDLQRCILRGRCSTRDMRLTCWEVRGLISREGVHFGASDLQVC